MSIGIQFLNTPLNTWGINSLDNRVIQHANSISSTMNQVGISVGTEFIVSLTALGGFLAPADASVQVVTMAGVHAAFCGMCVLLIIVVLGILIFVHEKGGKKASADAAAGSAAGTDSQAGVAAGPFVAFPSLEGIAGIDRPFLVSDVMNPQPNVVSQDATVRQAIDAMRATETSGVPVVDSTGGVVGFISDGDIMGYLSNQTGNLSDGTNYFALIEDQDFWTRLGSLLDLNVMRLATKRVISIEALDNAEVAFKLLSEKRIKKVPVLHQGKLVGTLSRRNVMNALATAETMLAQSAGAKAGA